MGDSLEQLRSKIMASIAKKDQNKSLPSGPKGNQDYSLGKESDNIHVSSNEKVSTQNKVYNNVSDTVDLAQQNIKPIGFQNEDVKNNGEFRDDVSFSSNFLSRNTQGKDTSSPYQFRRSYSSRRDRYDESRSFIGSRISNDKFSRYGHQTSSNGLPLGGPNRFNSNRTNNYHDSIITNRTEKKANVSRFNSRGTGLPNISNYRDSISYRQGASHNFTHFSRTNAMDIPLHDKGHLEDTLERGEYSRNEHEQQQFNVYTRRRLRGEFNSMPVKSYHPHNNINWENIISIDARKRMRNTKWDITPVGFEKVPAERAKLSGLFPLPGKPQELDRSALQDIVSNGTMSRRTKILFEDPTKQNMALCRLNRTLVVTMISTFTMNIFLEYVKEYLDKFDTEYKVISSKAQGNTFLIEFNIEEAVAIFLSSQKLIQKNYDLTFTCRRPEEYVAREDFEDQICCENLTAINNFELKKEGEIIEWFENLGIKTKWSKLLKYKNKELVGVILFIPEENADHPAIEGAIRPNHALLRQEFSSIAYQVLPELVKARAHSPSRVICLLNCVDPIELKNEQFYQQIYDSMRFGTPIVSCGEVEEVKIPVPGPDYRYNFENIDKQIGKIFIMFKTLSSAESAVSTLSGSLFRERTIICSYYSERDFNLNLF